MVLCSWTTSALGRNHMTPYRFTCAGDGKPIGQGVQSGYRSCPDTHGSRIARTPRVVALVQLPNSRRANWINIPLENAHRCPIPDGGHPNIDLWPDVSEYSPSELYPAPGLKFVSGEQARLFSSRHPMTVQRSATFLCIFGCKI
jgi:hypothetical protein